MESQLQIRFEMDLPVLGDFTVTDELVPTRNTNLLCFQRAETANEDLASKQLRVSQGSASLC